MTHTIQHQIDCDLHNGPAMTPGPCSCGADPGRKPDPTTSEWPAPDASELAQILATLETVLVMGRDQKLVTLPIEQAHLLHKKLTMLVAQQQEVTCCAQVGPGAWCNSPATYTIHAMNTGERYDITEACEDHIGKLLGSMTDQPASHWEVSER